MIEKLHPVLACPPPQARAVPRLRHCPPHWKRWSCAVTDRKGSKRSVHPFESGGPRSLNQLPLVRVWSQCPRSGHNILVSLSGNGSPHPHPGGGYLCSGVLALRPVTRRRRVMQFRIVPPVPLCRPPRAVRCLCPRRACDLKHLPRRSVAGMGQKKPLCCRILFTVIYGRKLAGSSSVFDSMK